MIICPNFSDKNVLKEFNELKELVGEIGAYHIWNENNGNPIDQTKDGKPSAHFEHDVCVRKDKADILSDYHIIEQAEQANPHLFTNEITQSLA